MPPVVTEEGLVFTQLLESLVQDSKSNRVNAKLECLNCYWQGEYDAAEEHAKNCAVETPLSISIERDNKESAGLVPCKHPPQQRSILMCQCNHTVIPTGSIIEDARQLARHQQSCLTYMAPCKVVGGCGALISKGNLTAHEQICAKKAGARELVGYTVYPIRTHSGSSQNAFDPNSIIFLLPKSPYFLALYGKCRNNIKMLYRCSLQPNIVPLPSSIQPQRVLEITFERVNKDSSWCPIDWVITLMLCSVKCTPYLSRLAITQLTIPS